MRLRNDMLAVQHLLYQLKAGSVADVDIKFQISVLEINYLMRKGLFPEAFNLIEEVAEKQKEEDADIYQRTELLILKANLFAKCNKPERGFSVAIRAASTAHRAKLIPTLWEAIGALSNILIHLGELEAARRLLDAIIPQVSTSNNGPPSIS